MYDWIYSLIAASILPIRNLVNEITDRISSIWSTWTNTVAGWRGQADGWIGHLGELMPATLRQGLAVYTMLRYLLLVFVPGLVAQRVADAIRWAADRVAELRAYLLGQLALVRDWLVARIDDALGLLADLRSWIFARMAEVVDVVNQLLAHVFGPLGTPERLVAWIFGTLVTALATWMLDNIDVLAAEAFRRRRGLEDQALNVAGRIIDRIA